MTDELRRNAVEALGRVLTAVQCEVDAEAKPYAEGFVDAIALLCRPKASDDSSESNRLSDAPQRVAPDLWIVYGPQTTAITYPRLCFTREAAEGWAQGKGRVVHYVTAERAEKVIEVARECADWIEHDRRGAHRSPEVALVEAVRAFDAEAKP